MAIPSSSCRLISAERAVGSGLELDGEVLQLSAFTSDETAPRTRVARPSRRAKRAGDGLPLHALHRHPLLPRRRHARAAPLRDCDRHPARPHLYGPRLQGPDDRSEEASALVDGAVTTRGIGPGTLTLGTGNGGAFTSRGFRARLAEHGITHRRGGYRDPESQAVIESWFGALKERLVWRSEFETLEHARKKIGDYTDGYHQRPHSGLGSRTPTDVRRTCEGRQRLQKTAA